MVRASYPALGMGIALKHLVPEEERHLKQLITFLSGHNSAPPTKATEETADDTQNDIGSALEVADQKRLLDQVKDFFQKNKELSREEFHEIARRIRQA